MSANRIPRLAGQTHQYDIKVRVGLRTPRRHVGTGLPRRAYARTTTT